jgi:hypothetical protein
VGYSDDSDGVLGYALGEGACAVNGITGHPSTACFGASPATGAVHLYLQPRVPALTGPPANGKHKKGSIFLDSNADLFVCVTGDGSDLGTWKQVSYGGSFVAIDPVRICDTRVGHGPGGAEDNPYNTYANGPIAAYSDLTVKVSGQIGPSGHQAQFVPTTASAVVFNFTVTAWQHGGNATCYPANLANVPTVSNINWPEPPTELAALGNLVNVKLGAITGDSAHTGIKVHNASGGSTEVIIDLAGYYS